MSSPFDRCAQCGAEIVRGSSHSEDILAYEEGFCGSGCMDVAVAIMALDTRFQMQEGR